MASTVSGIVALVFLSGVAPAKSAMNSSAPHPGATPLTVAGYVLTPVDDPAANNQSGTILTGVNNLGDVTGYYIYYTTESAYSFRYHGGKFRSIADPQAPNNTEIIGINDSGILSGGIYDVNTRIYYGIIDANGTFALVSPPGAAFTSGAGINNSGTMVGSYTDAAGVNHGFSYYQGSFSTVDVPSAVGTFARAISNAGVIGGWYYDGSVTHGFIEKNGKFKTIDDPNATTLTQVTGVNKRGEIVGAYQDAQGTHGFVDVNGVFQTIDAPMANGLSVISGVNDKGVLTGFYSTNGSYTTTLHGFIATPSR
jgi:hypothetical protein